jgi:hypothetical protein
MSEKRVALTRPDTLYIGIKEASRISGLSEYRVRKWCRDRAIPCIVTGHCYSIDREAFIAFLKDLARSYLSKRQ